MKANALLAGRTVAMAVVASVMFLAVGGRAQNLFVADEDSGNIYEYTPGGTQSIFATGFSNAVDGLAFNSAGSLYVSAFGLTAGTGSIDIINPGGTKNTFATGFYEPRALAFDSAGDLFVANSGDNDVIEIAPNGSETTFAQGLDFPFGMAFAPVPELSEFVLAGVGILILFVVRRFHGRATTFIRCRKTQICPRSPA